MSWEGWFTVVVIGIMTLAIARDRIGPDLGMFSALCLLTVSGVLEPKESIAGLANPAIVIIGTLFMVVAAIKQTGALKTISRWVLGHTESSRVGLARIVIPTALLSAFMNNTPIVAMLIPVTKDFARRIEASPSQFLIPLAYASMLGGTCTLIGTSANLVVSGQLTERGLPPLGMFEIGWIGVPVALIGVAYLLTVAPLLLRTRVEPKDQFQTEVREYLAEVEVEPDSPLIGRTVLDAGLRHLPGLFLAAIRRRNGQTVRPVAPESRLHPGDHLVFSGVASTVRDLRSLPGLSPIDEPRLGRDIERSLFEVVVSHRSELIGRTARDVEFRRRFNAAILAVHRTGERIEEKIGDIVLRPGDTLMLSASPGFRDTWENNPSFYVVSAVVSDAPPRYRQANLSLAILLGLVLVPTLTDVPMLIAAMGAAVALLLTNCISTRAARQAIEWSVLLVIGCALGLARALETSGAADTIANTLLLAASPFGPIGVIAAIYLLGVATASMVSNAAAAALVFPIALTAAETAGLDVRPVAVTVALSASAAFSTPVGSNPLLLVSSLGGYRYLDFTRVGLPLNLVTLIVVLLVLPAVWPLVTTP